MVDQMTSADVKKVAADYNWILGMALEDPTDSIQTFWKELRKVIRTSAGDTAVIEAFVQKQLPEIDAFKGMYAQQAKAEILDAQPALEADVERATEQQRQVVQLTAEKYGAKLTPEREMELADAAWRNGWSASEILMNMRDDLTATLAAGDTTGAAGDYQNQLAQWAAQNGLDLSAESANRYVANMTLGSQSLDDVKADLRKTYLAGMYPAWADRINSGYDPSVIFEPYRNSIGRLLEMSDVGLDDPLMKQITQAVGSDGKPAAMPLYEAERMARSDPRWQKTDNAYATYAGVAQNLLRTFGFA